MSRQRKAVVTGAATGLGREIASGLANAGYRLALGDINAAGLQETLGESSFHGSVSLPLDLRSEASIVAFADRAWAELGGIDLLVNNAGITIHKPALDLTWADWDAVQDVNLKGAFFLSRSIARHWLNEKREGSIVNLASAHGIVGFPDRSAYGISKAAIIHMSKMLAIEWAKAGIRVNAIAPTTIMTPSRAELLKEPEKRERMLGRIPLGRFPDADEVAGAVLYLDSAAARSITGHTIVLDGGTTVA